jgi:hypothetical protein
MSVLESIKNNGIPSVEIEIYKEEVVNALKSILEYNKICLQVNPEETDAHKVIHKIVENAIKEVIPNYDIGTLVYSQKTLCLDNLSDDSFYRLRIEPKNSNIIGTSLLDIIFTLKRMRGEGKSPKTHYASATLQSNVVDLSHLEQKFNDINSIF